MPKVVTSRLGICYQQAGEGPDVVMIHGLAANQVFWYSRILPAFAPDFRVTIYDLRGHGMSDMPPTGYTTRDHAEDLLGLLDALEIEKPHLVGHSLGGAICAHFATLFPERLATLNLLDCRLHALQPMVSRDDETHWAKRRAEIAAKGIPIPEGTPRAVYTMLEELTPLANAGMINPNAIPGLVIQNGVWNPASRSAKRWMNLAKTTTIAQDLLSISGLTREKIAAISQPVLLLFGADSNCLPTGLELEKLLPQAHLVVLPGLGHFFPVVQPALVVEHIRNFLQEHPAIPISSSTLIESSSPA
jgi:pimeloyl-ACP methyl ester carboxylesterase